ncbi:Hypothetical protein BRZCDTV_112 [Brazilian cedratvirus IHUMI]|uniref:Uncharacterized protein n=1 Tax=Brazilian cedratvirus IHUMI TaxID=2126980 RepID=A0A2R8FDB7_9VIRU|nr:Hypothetical protein BRZCDTV_112 [Brazilian cedratvirus IHUMI]
MSDLYESYLTPRDYVNMRGCFVCGSKREDLHKAGQSMLCSFHHKTLCNPITFFFTKGYLESLTDYQCTALCFSGKCTEVPEKDKPRCNKHHRGGLESLVLRW